MTGPVVPQPGEAPRPESAAVSRISLLARFRLRLLRIRWVVSRLPLESEWIGAAVPRRLERRERELMPGELIVATAASAVDLANLINIIQQLAPLPGIADVPIKPSRQDVDPESAFLGREVGLLPPAPLTSNYFGLHCRRGYEQYLLRCLRIAARSALARSSFEVVRSVRVRAAAPDSRPGPIVFTPVLDETLQAGWLSAPASTGAGCAALMIDFDHPDPDVVDDVWPLGGAVGGIVDGHATVMAAAFRRMAPDAALHSVAMGPPNEVGSWTVLDELTAGRRGHDLIFAGIELTAGPAGREGRARRRVIERWLTDISNRAPFPVLVFPTGNSGRGEPADTIAIPACLNGVVAIGSIGSDGRRSRGSRFRRRSAPEPAHWWMVPGGDFPDESEQTSLMMMAAVPQAGTSVATGLGAGLLAGVVAEVRDSIRLGRAWLPTALAAAEAELEQARLAGMSEAELVALREAVDSMEHLNAPGPAVLPLVEQRSAAAPTMLGYTPETCGRGVLRVSP